MGVSPALLRPKRYTRRCASPSQANTLHPRALARTRQNSAGFHGAHSFQAIEPLVVKIAVPICVKLNGTGECSKTSSEGSWSCQYVLFALLCCSLDRACAYPTRPLFRRDLCAGMMAEEARLLFQMLQQFGSKQVCDRRSTVCFAIPSEVCQMSAVLVCPLAAACPAECRTPIVKVQCRHLLPQICETIGACERPPLPTPTPTPPAVRSDLSSTAGEKRWYAWGCMRT